MSKTTHTVWDLEGNPHEMSYENARDMVQHMGWARTAPRVVVKAAEASQEPATDAAPAKGRGRPKGGAKAKEPEPAPEPEKEQEVDLTAMDRDQLAAYAKEHFDMDFGADVSQGDILEAILSEME